MLPFLNKYNLVNPFKRDNENIKVFKNAVKELLSESKDTKSIGYKLSHCDELTEQQKIDDMVAIMVGGAETTSHSLMSCLYFLKKYPENYKRLRKELEDNGFGQEFEKNFTLDKVQDLNFLNSFIKEALRMDSVLSDTFDYMPLDDIEI